mgnify:CR=1 FL=1
MVGHGQGLLRRLEHVAPRPRLRPQADQAGRILQVFVVCPEVGIPFPWTHGRPKWFDERFSRNAAAGAGADPDDVVDGEVVERT